MAARSRRHDRADLDRARRADDSQRPGTISSHSTARVRPRILYRVNARTAIAASDGGPVWSEGRRGESLSLGECEMQPATPPTSRRRTSTSPRLRSAGTPMPIFQTERSTLRPRLGKMRLPRFLPGPTRYASTSPRTTCRTDLGSSRSRSKDQRLLEPASRHSWRAEGAAWRAPSVQPFSTVRST